MRTDLLDFSWRRRWALVALRCLVVLAGGCGGGGDDFDAPTLAVSNGNVRIRCGGGDCTAGVLHDSGLYFVGVTRTIDGVIETHSVALEHLGGVDIETGAGKDRVQLVDTGVHGTLRIATGAGDDFLDLCDAGATGDTRIETGPGDDYASFAPGTYARTFRLALGDGDDVVVIGGGGFFGAVTLDGGAGDDRSDVAATFHEAPHVVGFENNATAGDVFSE